MKFYLAKVSYYDSIGDNIVQDCLTIAGSTFADAIKTIEDYYGVVEDIFIEIINPEYPFAILPNEETYEAIRETGGY